MVLAILAVTGLGLWVFVRDRVDFDLRRIDLIRTLTGETKKLQAALADVDARMAQIRVEIRAAEERADQSAKVAKDIESANSGFNRLTTSSEQAKEDETRVARLKQMEADARHKASDLQQILIRTQWEKDGLEIAVGKSQAQIKKAEEEKSKVVHYAREAWEKYGRVIVTMAAVYFFGPPIGRLLLYFIVAPIISSRQPVRIGRATEAQPQVVTSHASVDVALEPADTLWVKEKFLQASDEGLLRSTRWLLSWRMPFTCLATGLMELIEMRNAAPEISMKATFSSQDDPHTELAVVTVPAGSSLVLRPTYLAGLIGPLGRRNAAIRRHWRLFTMQSWVTGQFRYFEFVGPCKLLVAGTRGVRAEVLAPVTGVAMPARRTNQDATLGFTPGLAY
ncbi:MAG TPA: hypothetical protein VFJ90_16200, partial [Candidatus Didemnitutus sp.]|nr:hypothetical protein [Candidatus Didemnitutus sp.]